MADVTSVHMEVRGLYKQKQCLVVLPFFSQRSVRQRMTSILRFFSHSRPVLTFGWRQITWGIDGFDRDFSGTPWLGGSSWLRGQEWLRVLLGLEHPPDRINLMVVFDGVLDQTSGSHGGKLSNQWATGRIDSESYTVQKGAKFELCKTQISNIDLCEVSYSRGSWTSQLKYNSNNNYQR